MNTKCTLNFVYILFIFLLLFVIDPDIKLSQSSVGSLQDLKTPETKNHKLTFIANVSTRASSKQL